MEKPFVNKTPKELDSHLKENFKLGIYPYAVTLSYFIHDSLMKNIGYCHEAQEAHDMISRLEKLKKDMIMVIGDLEKKILGHSEQKSLYKKDGKKAEDQVSEDKDFGYVLNFINENIAGFKSGLKYATRGTPTRARNMLSTAWGLLVKNAISSYDWNLVANLLDWFWKRLRWYAPYQELDPEKRLREVKKSKLEDNEEFVGSDPEYIKNQYYRKKVAVEKILQETGLAYWENNCTDINSIVILGATRLELYRIKEIKQKHDSFFAEYREDLATLENAIASKNYYLDLSDLNWPWMYRYYAYKLYKANPKNPPKVIFPDLSFV